MLVSDLLKKNPPAKEIFSVKLYRLDSNFAWSEVQIEKNRESIFLPVKKEVLSLLDSAFKKSYMLINNKPGETYVFNAIIRTDEKPGPNSINLVNVRIARNIFFDKIKSDKELLIGYAFILIIISLILGKHFALQITNPVNELIEAARNISHGDFTYRNMIMRNDEIGYLAKTFNLMADKVDSHIKEIEYKANTMEAMNRIDKTVLTKLFDEDLIDTVAEIVATFLQEGMVILAIPDEEKKIIKINSYHADKTDGIKYKNR